MKYSNTVAKPSHVASILHWKIIDILFHEKFFSFSSFDYCVLLSDKYWFH